MSLVKLCDSVTKKQYTFLKVERKEFLLYVVRLSCCGETIQSVKIEISLL